MPRVKDGPAVEFDWAGNLRAAMADHAMDRRELAQRSGVSVSMIGMILCRERAGSVDVHVRLAEALDEDVAWVFPRTAEEKARAEAWRIPVLHRHLLPRYDGLRVSHVPPVGGVQDVADL